MIAILQNIRSLHNVGSIFRTADAAGVKKLYLCGITPTPTDKFGKIRPQLAKVSLGAEKTVAWEKCRQTSRLIEKLKKSGYKILAIEQNKSSVPYYDINSKISNLKKIALIVGHEIKGLPKEILKKSNAVLEIPMYGKKESLNVAVAFAIVMFHLIRNLRNKSVK